MTIEKKASGLLGSFIFSIVAVMLIIKVGRDIAYYYDDSVVAVSTVADAGKLHDNSIVEISLGLDFEKAYGVSYLSQREFVLIPFTGLGYKLMYVVEGPMSDKLRAKLHPPFKGRVAGKCFLDDSWEVYDKPMKLKKLFARDDIELPGDALLVYDAPKELPGSWQFVVGGLSVIYLIYKASSLVRMIRGRGQVVLG